METFGSRLKKIALVRYYTTTELAESIGVSKVTMNSWLSDKTLPSKENLHAISETLNISKEFLIFGISKEQIN